MVHKTTFILWIIIFSLISYFVGYNTGYLKALSWGVDTAYDFLEYTNNSLYIDKNILTLGVFMYKNQINSIAEVARMCNISDASTLKDSYFKNDGYLDTSIFNKS